MIKVNIDLPGAGNDGSVVYEATDFASFPGGVKALINPTELGYNARLVRVEFEDEIFRNNGQNYILYAGVVDEADAATVTYNLNGGVAGNKFVVSGTNDRMKGSIPSAVSIMKGARMGYPNCNPERIGSVFTGWYTDESCAEEFLFSFTSPVTASMTLYAGFEVAPIPMYNNIKADEVDAYAADKGQSNYSEGKWSSIMNIAAEARTDIMAVVDEFDAESTPYYVIIDAIAAQAMSDIDVVLTLIGEYKITVCADLDEFAEDFEDKGVDYSTTIDGAKDAINAVAEGTANYVTVINKIVSDAKAKVIADSVVVIVEELNEFAELLLDYDNNYSEAGQAAIDKIIEDFGKGTYADYDALMSAVLKAVEDLNAVLTLVGEYKKAACDGLDAFAEDFSEAVLGDTITNAKADINEIEEDDEAYKSKIDGFVSGAKGLVLAAYVLDRKAALVSYADGLDYDGNYSEDGQEAIDGIIDDFAKETYADKGEIDTAFGAAKAGIDEVLTLLGEAKEAAYNAIDVYAEAFELDLDGIIEAAKELIEAVEEGTEGWQGIIDGYVADAKADILAAYVADRAEALQAYADGLGYGTDGIDGGVYTAKGEAAIDAIINGFAEGEYADKGEADGAFDQAKLDIADVPTRLDELKEAAKNELNDYASEADYSPANWLLVRDEIAKGKTAIGNAADAAGVTEALAAAKAEINNIPVELSIYKESKKSELQAYANEEDYSGINWLLVSLEIAAGKAFIDDASDKAGVDEALTWAKGEIDKIKTLAQEFAEYQEAAKEELEGYADEGDFTADNWLLVLDEIEAGITAIEAAVNEAGVDEALAAAKLAIDEILNAQKAAAALAAHKEDRTTALQALYDGKNKGNYDEDGLDLLLKALNAGKSTIAASASISEVDANFNAASAAINNVQTVVEDTLTPYKEGRKQELQEVYDGIDLELYDAEGKSALLSALNAGKTAIDGSADEAAVDVAFEIAVAALGEVETIVPDELTPYKAGMKNELQAAYNQIDKDKYDATGKAALLEALNNGKAAIDAAEDKGEVDAAFNTAVANLNSVPKAFNAAEYKADKVTELTKLYNDAKKDNKYTDANWAKVETAFEEGVAAINDAADDKAAIDEAFGEAKAALLAAIDKDGGCGAVAQTFGGNTGIALGGLLLIAVIGFVLLKKRVFVK